MTRELVCAGVVIGVLVAVGRADGAPAIQIYTSRFAGSGILCDGGLPGEDQYGSYGIINTGTTTLTVTDMALSSDGAAVFEYEGEPLCGTGTDCRQTFTLAPGEGRWFSTSCTAPLPGTYSGMLTVKSNATSGSSAVPLPCKGFYPPVLQVTPAALDFGSAHTCWWGDSCGPSCHTRPASQTLTITNAAPEPSELDVHVDLNFSGFSFTIDADQVEPFALGAGQSAHVTFTYHPTPPGQVYFDGPLTLTPTYPLGLVPIELPFHAQGGSGWFVMDSTSEPTGPVGEPLVGTITGHDAGDSCLSVDEIGFWGLFQVLDPPGPLLLQADEAVTWQVSCTPTQVLEPTCEWFGLGWAYDEPESGLQYMFCCYGLGGALLTTPGMVQFTGDLEVAVGTSATQRLRVFNAGSRSTDLVAMTPDDPHVTVALASGSLPVTLAPGEDTFIDVTFAPTDATWMYTTILLDGSSGDDYSLGVISQGVVAPGARIARAENAVAVANADAGCTTGGPASSLLGLGFVLVILPRWRRR